MRKLLLLTLLFPLFAHSQQTFTVAAPGTSFTPTWRVQTNVIDSLSTYWMGNGGNKWYWMYSGVQQNNRFVLKSNIVSNFATVNSTLIPNTLATANLLYTLKIKAQAYLYADTNVTLSGNQVIHNITTTSGNYILLNGQTINTNNGLWIADAGAWIRSNDSNTGPNIAGSIVSVSNSDILHAGVYFNDQASINLGTTPISYTKIGGSGLYTAGYGLNLSGSAFKVDSSLIQTVGNFFTKGNTTWLKKSNNLSDVASASTSRTNLGLGSSSAVTFGSLSFTSMTPYTLPATKYLTIDNSTGQIKSRVVDSVLKDIGAAKSVRNINTGFGLTGGGNLSADRTIIADTATALKGKAGFLTDYNNLYSRISPKQPRIIGVKPLPTGTSYTTADTVTQIIANLDSGIRVNSSYINWDSPQKHGAYGDNVHDDTAPLRAALLSPNVHLYGTYFTTDTVAVGSNFATIYSENARIRNTTTTGHILVLNGRTKVSLIGHLRISGAGSTTAGTAVGLMIYGGNTINISNIDVDNIAGDGLLIKSGPAYIRGNTPVIHDCQFINNYNYGFHIAPGTVGGSEYVIFHHNIVANNNYAGYIEAGNVTIDGNNIVDNVNGVTYGIGTGNNAHGIFANNNCNHNTNYNLNLVGINLGLTISNNHFYNASATSIIITSDGSTHSFGVVFDGGQIDGTVTIDALSQAYMSNMTLLSTYTVTGTPAQIKYENCQTLSGSYSGNQEITATGSNFDLDMGTHIITAKNFVASGTAGGGYLRLAKQSVSPASLANNLTFYADSLNRASWKNDLYRRTIWVNRLADMTIKMPYRLNPIVADSTDVAAAIAAAVSTGANPTATAGTSAVNGSATTYMRSDAAPKIDSAAFRTAANSPTLAALQTKFNLKLNISDTTGVFARVNSNTAKNIYSNPATSGTGNNVYDNTNAAINTQQNNADFSILSPTGYTKFSRGALTYQLTTGGFTSTLNFNVPSGASVTTTMPPTTGTLANAATTLAGYGITDAYTKTAGDARYPLVAGLAGGQSITGGTAASENLTLLTTSNATKGKVIFGVGATTAFDGVNDRFGVGTASPTAKIDALSTTEQLRLEYDGTHYASFTVNSTGALTIAPTGATTTLNSNFATSSTNYGQFYTSYNNSLQPYDASSDWIAKQRNNSFGFVWQNSSAAQQAKLTGAGVWTWNAYGLGNIVSSAGGAITSSQAGFIQASADLTAQTAAGNITTFTVGAATATFNISTYINVTAVSVDVIQGQVTYTDENNTAQTISLSNLSAIGNSTYNPVTIRAKNGTVITVKTNLTTGAGSIQFDCGARVMQM